MRFGKKTFIISVIAFVLCLNLGFLSLLTFTYKTAVNTKRELCKIQFENIVSDFENSYNSLVFRQDQNGVYELMNAFCRRYNDEKTYLRFLESDGEEIKASSQEFDKTIEIADQDSIEEVDDADKNRYVMINAAICDGKYYMVYAININDMIAQQNEIIFKFAISSVVIFVLFTLILYFTMRNSSRVLEQTVETVDMIADGDMDAKEYKLKGREWSKVEKSFNNMLKTVNGKIDEANRNADRKQMLVNHVADQLNMPLTSISRTAGDILNRGNCDEKTAEGVKLMQSEAHRLQDMSQKLLDIAYVKKQKLNITDVNVSALLSDVAYRFKKYAQSIGIKVETSLSEVTVKADETLLSILFYNLTDNAIKACHSGCTVTLSCENKTVVIADNGAGLTKEQLEKITEPFYKTEKSRDKNQGFGLGLALCKEIIDAHGAEIRFESEQGYGTKVFIDFEVSKE